MALVVVTGAVAALWPAAVSAQRTSEFSYHGPGELQPVATERGVRDRRVYFPGFHFPLRVGPDAGSDGEAARAYLNSQIFRAPSIAVNGIENYVYPWRDNYCESQRSWSMPNCPRGRGHQGQDIRPSTPQNSTWDVVAADDGVVTSVTGNTTVIVRSSANTGASCRYLHMQPVLVKKGQKVVKGVTVLGKVSNLMGGEPGTSIHLHFDCEATHPELGRKVFMPIYTSLVASYRRAWGMPDMIEEQVLLRDPERELGAHTSGCGAKSEPLEATAGLKVSARLVHNCSEMGLVVDSAAAQIVYLRPQQAITESAKRNPVLIRGSIAEGRFVGKAIRFNKDCNDPAFEVTGEFSADAKSIVLSGSRQVLNSKCERIGTSTEKLVFEPFSTSGDEVKPDPLPGPSGPTCPFGLKPGEKPRLVGGREIPPKSERSCNFTAITVPGGIPFRKMPQYIQQWPGILSEILIDKFEDQIITLRTAEAGVGMWYYWLLNRAVNGPDLKRKGFGAKPTPTLAELARAIAGKERSDDYVRKIYLEPYLRFAATYFGRPLDDDEQIDMSNADNRWNVARTMFRLESGREPVVSRRQFECGIAFGTDVDSDFKKAGIEKEDATNKVQFSAFRGLAHYVDVCGSGDKRPPTPEPAATGDVAEFNRRLTAATTQIGALEKEKLQLTTEKRALEQRLTSSVALVTQLEQEVARLKSAGSSPASTGQTSQQLEALQNERTLLQTRLQAAERELALTNQLLRATIELCKLKGGGCT